LGREGVVSVWTQWRAEVGGSFDSVIFLKEGQIVLQESVDSLRSRTGSSVETHFKEVFKC